MRTLPLTAVLLSLSLTACATRDRPDAALAAGGAAFDAARSAGAAELAPQTLQQAQNKLARVQALAQAGDEQAARRLAEQAQADAHLARAQSASERSRRAAEEVQASLRSLREEMQRGSGPMPQRPTR
jgi:hypothetical protein